MADGMSPEVKEPDYKESIAEMQKGAFRWILKEIVLSLFFVVLLVLFIIFIPLNDQNVAGMVFMVLSFFGLIAIVIGSAGNKWKLFSQFRQCLNDCASEDNSSKPVRVEPILFDVNELRRVLIVNSRLKRLRYSMTDYLDVKTVVLIEEYFGVIQHSLYRAEYQRIRQEKYPNAISTRDEIKHTGERLEALGLYLFAARKKWKTSTIEFYNLYLFLGESLEEMEKADSKVKEEVTKGIQHHYSKIEGREKLRSEMIVTIATSATVSLLATIIGLGIARAFG